jgi:hypothetical protein
MNSVEDISLVVRFGDKYLNGSDAWASYKEAWHYSTAVAFDHAETYGGMVVMVLPNGRQVAVTSKDFEAP